MGWPLGEVVFVAVFACQIDGKAPLVGVADVAQPAQRQRGAIDELSGDIGEPAAVAHGDAGQGGPTFAGAVVEAVEQSEFLVDSGGVLATASYRAPGQDSAYRPPAVSSTPASGAAAPGAGVAQVGVQVERGLRVLAQDLADRAPVGARVEGVDAGSTGRSRPDPSDPCPAPSNSCTIQATIRSS
jgi:hypothetical protein